MPAAGLLQENHIINVFYRNVINYLNLCGTESAQNKKCYLCT
jgi:hypothetical protein